MGSSHCSPFYNKIPGSLVCTHRLQSLFPFFLKPAYRVLHCCPSTDTAFVKVADAPHTVNASRRLVASFGCGECLTEGITPSLLPLASLGSWFSSLIGPPQTPLLASFLLSKLTTVSPCMVPGPLFSSVHSLSALRYLIHALAFKYHQYADSSQLSVSSPDLSPEL